MACRSASKWAFYHRTRLTGLATGEAEALAIWLSAIPPALGPLGLESAARRARAKLVESLPEQNRAVIAATGHRYSVQDGPVAAYSRVQAMVEALRDHRLVVLRSGSAAERRFRPERLGCDSRGWRVEGLPPTVGEWREDWGNIVAVRPLC